MELSKKIEALLFFRAEPMGHKELAKLLVASESEIREAVTLLKETLVGRGIQLMEKDGEMELRTAPEASEFIEKLRKEELTRDLGKAGAETLAVVLYQGHSTRAEIDYIRGVNSTFILRNLLIRGLIERVSNPKDQRSFVYRPTFDILAHLGVKNVSELPDFDAVRREIDKFAETEGETLGHNE